MKGLSGLVLFPLMLTAASPKMRIGYFGHAFLEVVLPSGVRVVMDPFDPYSPYPIGLDFPFGLETDVVIVTHGHPDHRGWWVLEGSPELFFSEGGTWNGIDVVAHPTKHGPGTEEGTNYIMTWETGGLKFAEMGGYGDTYSPEDSAVLAGTDFLFFPAGSYYAMNANLFNPIIRNVGPVVAFPEHYRTPDHNYQHFGQLLTLEEANELLDFPIETFEDAWIAVDTDELPEGPVLWEPGYSPLLPGDLAVTGITAENSYAYEITVEVTNNSDIRDAMDAPLIITVYDGKTLLHSDTAMIDVSVESLEFVSFEPWEPPLTKAYTVWAEVIYPADEAPQNDTMSSGLAPLATTEVRPPGILKLNVNRDGETLFIEHSAPGGRITILDVTGRQVDEIPIGVNNEGTLQYPLDKLPDGVYFVNLATSQGSLLRRFTLLR